MGALIKAKDDRGVSDRLLVELQLDHVLDREIEVLSGGELQRFAILMVAVQNADVSAHHNRRRPSHAPLRSSTTTVTIMMMMTSILRCRCTCSTSRPRT